MRRILFILVVAVFIAVLVYLGWPHRKNISVAILPSQELNLPPTATVTNSQPPIGTAKEDRLQQLERLGEVPEGAPLSDFNLAEKTSWWGKPLDPKKFWAGRVLWLDASAIDAARRHGRADPPIPYDDPTLPPYKDDDGINWNNAEVEGPNLHFAQSSKEAAFWDKFRRTHPKPPEDLERYQAEARRDIVGGQLVFKDMTPQEITELENSIKNRMYEVGVPRELLTDEALMANYLMEKRKEHARLLEEGEPPNGFFVSNFLARLYVEPQLVTNADDTAIRQADRAWKIAYLQRLRSENTDEQYIQAYLKAWSLTETQVFGP